MNENIQNIREKFTEICLSYPISDNGIDTPNGNKITKRLQKLVTQEIGDHWGLGREAILPLLDHENEFVRRRAACYCIEHAIETERCLEVLTSIKASSPYRIHRMEIAGFLNLYKMGILVPKQAPVQAAPSERSPAQEEKKTLVRKYYCRMGGTCYPKGDSDGIPYSGADLLPYEKEIRGLFEKVVPEEGLHYWCGVDEVSEILLEPEIHGGALYACFTATLTSAFEEDSESALYKAIEGETFSGIGESMVNYPLSTEAGELYVILWEPGWKLYREEEFRDSLQR